MDPIDVQQALAATRFAIWTTFLLAAFVMLTYLYQSCRLRFWSGAPFDRAIAGWSCEALFISLQQAYWWGVEHLMVVGRCVSHDPRVYNVDVCREAAMLRDWAPYVTPFLYAGVLVGLVMIIPPLLTTISGYRIFYMGIGVKVSVVVLWSFGWWLAWV